LRSRFTPTGTNSPPVLVSTNESPATSTQRGSASTGCMVVDGAGVVVGVVAGAGVVDGSDLRTGLWEVGALALSAVHPTTPTTRANAAAARPILRATMRQDYSPAAGSEAVPEQRRDRRRLCLGGGSNPDQAATAASSMSAGVSRRWSRFDRRRRGRTRTGGPTSEAIAGFGTRRVEELSDQVLGIEHGRRE